MRTRIYLIFVTALCIALAYALFWSRRSQQIIVMNDPAYVRLLERRVPEVHMHGTPLDQAIAQLGKLTGTQIIVSWPVAKTMGFEKEQPVQLDATDISLRAALCLAMRTEPRTDVMMPMVESDGAVLLGAPESPVLRTYDLSDLFTSHLALKYSWRPSDRGAAGGYRAFTYDEDPSSYDAHNDQDLLIRSLQNSIDPSSWREFGGQIGTIQMWRGRMIVLQTESNHQEVARFIRKLRERGIFVPPAAGNPASTEETSSGTELRALLSRRIGRRHFVLTPFGKAINQMAKEVGAPIVPTSQIQAKLDTPVTVDVGPGTLGDALHTFLTAATLPGNEFGPFSIGMEDGFLHIGNEDQFPPPALLRIYDIRDLIFAQAMITVDSRYPGRGARQLSTWELETATKETVVMISRRSRAIDPLEMSRVRATDSMGAWAGRLVVTATAGGHRVIRQVIGELRAATTQPATKPTSRPASVKGTAQP